MSDYYTSNRTYFLSGSLIYSTEGSGSVDKSNGTEMTFNWFANQRDIDISHVLNISTEVSGSNTYMKDKGWYNA